MDRSDSLTQLCYLALLSGDMSEPITVEDAAYTLNAWREEGNDYSLGIANTTPEQLAATWNAVYSGTL